jgi:hypothetical protein
VASPNRLILPFHIQAQEMTSWCWSAVASSISFHFDDNSTWDQVEIVADAFNYDKQMEPDEGWNRAWRIEGGLSVVGCLARSIDGNVAFGPILNELRHNRPVCVEINWDAYKGHAVVICGCWLDTQNNAFYRVADPDHIADCPDWPPYRDMSERQLQNYLDEGLWKKSFLVCPSSN